MIVIQEFVGSIPLTFLIWYDHRLVCFFLKKLTLEMIGGNTIHGHCPNHQGCWHMLLESSPTIISVACRHLPRVSGIAIYHQTIPQNVTTVERNSLITLCGSTFIFGQLHLDAWIQSPLTAS